MTTKKRPQTAHPEEIEQLMRARLITQVRARLRRVEIDSQYLDGYTPPKLTPEQLEKASMEDLMKMAGVDLHLLDDETQEKTAGNTVDEHPYLALFNAYPVEKREKIRNLATSLCRFVDSLPVAERQRLSAHFKSAAERDSRQGQVDSIR